MSTIDTSLLPRSFVNAQGQLTVPESVAKAVAKGVSERIKDMPEAQKELFKDMVQAMSLAPSSKGKYDVDGALDRIEKLVDKVTDFAAKVTQLLGSSAIDLLSRALVEMAADQRKAALESRLRARDDAKTELMSQAQTMRDDAAKIMAGAIVGAVLQIAAAGLSIGASSKALGKLSDGDTTGAEITNAIGGAIKSIGDAVANAINSSLQAAAKIDQAQGTEHAAQAEEIKAKGDIAKELGDAVQDMVKAIINFLKELKDAQAEQMRSLTKL